MPRLPILGVRLDRTLNYRLEEEARKRYISKSAIVKMALAEWLNANERSMNGHSRRPDRVKPGHTVPPV